MILPSPTGAYESCRCCQTDLPLDPDGFCRNGCAPRRIDVGALLSGVGFSFTFVPVAGRVQAFIVGAFVSDERSASRFFACLDLPALEEEAARLWREDDGLRRRLIESAEVVGKRKPCMRVEVMA